jgi:aspartate/methionine/tyrosine aminotransferase
MPIQWGALPAAREPEIGVAAMRDAYRRRRDLALSILKPAGLADYEPDGAFYIMADVSSTGMSGDEFAVALLREERMAVAPGVGFAIQPEIGPDGIPRADPKASQRVRIAFCVSDEDLREGLTRMVRFAERARSKRGVKAGAWR